MANDNGGQEVKTGDKVVIPGVVKGELTNGDLVVETKYENPTNNHRQTFVVNSTQVKLEK